MAGRLAVVLSGGGSKGAFQVGVLDELITVRKVKVDIAVGTSTGAIQAAAVAQDDLPMLVRLWKAIRGPDDIYKKQGGTLLQLLTGKPSLYDAGPLKSLLRQNIDEAKIRASGKSLRIRIVNLTTGVAHDVAENSHNLADFVYASCAMPFAFEPFVTKAGNQPAEQWVDGGVRDVTPLDSALDLNPRGVLLIRASPAPQPTDPRRYKSLVSIGLRAVDILQSEVSINDYKNVNLINSLIAARDKQTVELAQQGIVGEAARKIMQPLVQELLRYRFAKVEMIEPSFEVSETLEFDPVKIDTAIKAGRKALNDAWPRIKPVVMG